MAERTEPTRLDIAPSAARFVLQAGEKAVASLTDRCGFTIAAAMNQAEGGPAARACLKLGPDEWLLIATGEDPADVASAFAIEESLAFSLVDVSERQVGLIIEGPGAAEALASGVLLDLSLEAFPVGMATRTIFEKATIILWRTAQDCFRIEVGRSFAPYVRALIEIAIAENAAEAACAPLGNPPRTQGPTSA